jgi:hypothetical protein
VRLWYQHLLFAPPKSPAGRPEGVETPGSLAALWALPEPEPRPGPRALSHYAGLAEYGAGQQRTWSYSCTPGQGAVPASRPLIPGFGVSGPVGGADG